MAESQAVLLLRKQLRGEWAPRAHRKAVDLLVVDLAAHALRPDARGLAQERRAASSTCCGWPDGRPASWACAHGRFSPLPPLQS